MSNRDLIVARTDELADGEMKEVTIGDKKLLLSRVGDAFYATAAHCPHYGAPLAEGVLNDKRVVCPWHHAVFDVTTGALKEPPAIDALPSFSTRVLGDDVLVRLPDDLPGERKPSMAARDVEQDRRDFVIVGAGAAGYMAAQTLREEGFAGRLVVVSREMKQPYDRPNLSKDYLAGEADPDWMPLRSRDFYRTHDIELLLGKTVTALDSERQFLELSDGGRISYDALLLTSGGKPRTIEVPGAELRNVMDLRSFRSADQIIDAAGKSTRAVIVGSGFIAMETAASLRGRNLPVTVVSPESVPFGEKFGKEIGAFFMRHHEGIGVRFRLGSRVELLEGDDKVEHLLLENGDRLAADLVIFGIGVEPATGYIGNLDLNEDGSIAVDQYLRAADKVFAAGDIARYTDWRTGRSSRIEHWRSAMQQGRTAALNMLGHDEPYRSIPFFWTKQAGLSFKYVGHAETWDDVIIEGSLDENEFLAYYIENDDVLAVAGNNRDAQLAAMEELMRDERMPTAERVKQGGFDPIAALH